MQNSLPAPAAEPDEELKVKLRHTSDTARAMTTCGFQEDNWWAGFD